MWENLRLGFQGIWIWKMILVFIEEESYQDALKRREEKSKWFCFSLLSHKNALPTNHKPPNHQKTSIRSISPVIRLTPTSVVLPINLMFFGFLILIKILLCTWSYPCSIVGEILQGLCFSSAKIAFQRNRIPNEWNRISTSRRKW